jgi:hypothetical protein
LIRKCKTPTKKKYRKSIDRIVESTYKRKRKSLTMLPKRRVISPIRARRDMSAPRTDKKTYKRQ